MDSTSDSAPTTTEYLVSVTSDRANSRIADDTTYVADDFTTSAVRDMTSGGSLASSSEVHSSTVLTPTPSLTAAEIDSGESQTTVAETPGALPHGKDDSSGSGFEMYYYAIIGVGAVIVIVIFFVICCVCVRKRKKKPENKMLEAKDIHDYRPQKTDAEQSQPHSLRYVRDPTNPLSYQPDDAPYQDLPDHHLQNQSPVDDSYPNHHLPRVAGSGVYASNIQGHYRGSNQHSQASSPVSPMQQTQWHSTNLNTNSDYRLDPNYSHHDPRQHGTNQIRDTRDYNQGQSTSQRVYDTHDSSLNQQAQDSYNNNQGYSGHNAHWGKNTHNNYQLRPQQTTHEHRLPRQQPVYVPYRDAMGPQFNPPKPHPPATHPKPKVLSPLKEQTDVVTLKKNLKPTMQNVRGIANDKATGDELRSNPLFQQVRKVIDSGCKTIRLYNTSDSIAVLGFHADEQEIYNDAETTPANLPRNSVHINSYEHEGTEGQDEDIYDFIRNSCLRIESFDQTAIAQNAVANELPERIPEEPSPFAGGGEVYEDPDDPHGVTKIYDTSTSTKKQPMVHEQLKDHHNKAGILGELQQRQQTSHEPEDYVNIPKYSLEYIRQADAQRTPKETHNTQTEMTREYENKEVIDLLHQQGPPKDASNEYTNGHVIEELRKQGPPSASEPQEEYVNEIEIQNLARTNMQHHYPQGDYVNGDTITDISNQKAQQENNLYHNTDEIRLRNSMPPEQLGENIDQLFNTVLRDSENTNTRAMSNHKGPVLLRKSRVDKKAADNNDDYRISRSSLFADVDAESGPDLKQNMVQWPAQTVTPQMVTSKATAATQKKTQGGWFGFRKN